MLALIQMTQETHPPKSKPLERKHWRSRRGSFTTVRSAAKPAETTATRKLNKFRGLREAFVHHPGTAREERGGCRDEKSFTAVTTCLSYSPRRNNVPFLRPGIAESSATAISVGPCTCTRAHALPLTEAQPAFREPRYILSDISLRCSANILPLKVYLFVSARCK